MAAKTSSGSSIQGKWPLSSKTMTSNSPVNVTFGTGTIQANGLEINNDGKNILFHDRVRAKFQGQPGEGDGKP